MPIAKRKAQMAASDSAMVAYSNEHRTQLRQSESQRAVLTNYVLAVAAALSRLVVQQRFAIRTLPVSVLVVLIGLYGALAAAKYHERANYHLRRARALTQALAQSGDLPDNKALLDRSLDEHAQKFPRLYRLRLHWPWTGLHLGVATYGLVLVILIMTVR
jgi:hypothetical protein